MVPHQVLLFKLVQMEITGRMFNFACGPLLINRVFQCDGRAI